jgi:AraC-like DNA-binding protein
MALFQQTFGTTLIKYVTEHRLSHAQRLLVTTKNPIVVRNITTQTRFEKEHYYGTTRFCEAGIGTGRMEHLVVNGFTVERCGRHVPRLRKQLAGPPVDVGP